MTPKGLSLSRIRTVARSLEEESLGEEAVREEHNKDLLKHSYDMQELPFDAKHKPI